MAYLSIYLTLFTSGVRRLSLNSVVWYSFFIENIEYRCWRIFLLVGPVYVSTERLLISRYSTGSLNMNFNSVQGITIAVFIPVKNTTRNITYGYKGFTFVVPCTTQSWLCYNHYSHSQLMEMKLSPHMMARHYVFPSCMHLYLQT